MKLSVASVASRSMYCVTPSQEKERGLVEVDARFHEPLLEVLAAEVDGHVDDAWCIESKLFETSELPTLRLGVIDFDQGDLLSKSGPAQRE